jgi:tetratricopeptide (TPR) repeat protein
MLRDLRRLAESSERWSEYAQLLQDVSPEILDGELVVFALTQVAEVARERLANPELARRCYERVLEQQPDSGEALDALEELTTAAHDHQALLEVLRRKTDLAQDGDERVRLLLRRAKLNERDLEDLPSAIECFEQALVETKPREAYDGLERLYARAERWIDLASHYERMLEASASPSRSATASAQPSSSGSRTRGRPPSNSARRSTSTAATRRPSRRSSG